MTRPHGRASAIATLPAPCGRPARPLARPRRVRRHRVCGRCFAGASPWSWGSFSSRCFFFAERRGRVASRAHGRAGAGGLLGPAGSYGEEPKALGGMRGLLNHAIPAVEVGKCCPPVVRCGLLAKRLTQSWLRARWRTLGRSREKWIGRSGTGEQFRLTCEGPVGSQSRRALPVARRLFANLGAGGDLVTSYCTASRTKTAWRRGSPVARES